MTEASVARSLIKALKVEMPGSVVIKHADQFTSGIPDLSVTWSGRTVWLELKVTPVKSKGIQHLTACRLAAAGLCRYVVYDERKHKTFLVEPRWLDDMESRGIWVAGTLAVRQVLLINHLRELINDHR